MQYARASAAAIAAVMALSPIYAAPPKPIVDLSKSPALSEEKATPAAQPKASNGLDETTMELGGGALAVLVLGGVALAVSRRKRKREEESWHFDEPAEPVAEAEPMTLTEPVASPEPASPEPAMVAPPMSAFDWNKEPRPETANGSDCEDLETWTERAKCGPTEDNPSQSLKKRMKRAAFFEKRDREVAAGEAAPVEPDAGLPESLEEHA
jgi:hypothetical protein